MSILYLDFETTGTVDLKKVGTWAYSRHPDTDVLCFAAAVNDECIRVYDKHGKSFAHPNATPFRIYDRHDEVEAHNAFFERAIWTNIMVARYGWPEIYPESWRCSAALAASKGLPRGLEQVAQVLKLKNQKDPAGKKFISLTNGPKRRDLTPTEAQALYEYCKQDVAVERELSTKLGVLPEKEQALWQVDQRINLRGMHFDRKSVESAIILMEEYTDGLKKEVKEITKGKLDSTNQVKATLDWLKAEGVDLHDLQKGTVEIALKNGHKSLSVGEVLKIRQQLSKNSVKKLQVMINAGDSDDRIRDCFMYHGASTGRWTGKLVQLQNLPRGLDGFDADTCIDLLGRRDLRLIRTLYPDVMGAISSCIRGMLTAKEGHTLIAADYNAIETRVLFWLANEEKGLKAFREGTDLYVDMAQAIYKGGEITKTRRNLGKQAVLGCGYQMGPEKFKATCDKYGMDVEQALADIAVQAYREKYVAVVQYWYAMNDAAINAVQKPGVEFQVRKKVGWIYDKKQNVLGLRLPSGRYLRYWWPSIKQNKFERPALHFFSVDAQTKRWAEESTYGGKLVENAVQAVARDLLAEAMIRLDHVGCEIVLHAHDEIVIEALEGPSNMESVLQYHMEVLPPWAEGLPIKAETWVSKRYKK